MLNKIEVIINLQDYIQYYGEQVINMVGMSDMDDISELISQLLNEHPFILLLDEKLSNQNLIICYEI
jgi:hypothetical protein